MRRGAQNENKDFKKCRKRKECRKKMRKRKHEIQIIGNADCMSVQNNVERIKMGSENVRKNYRATNQYKEIYTMSDDRLINSAEF
jgi:hypothetical protein